MKDAIAGLFEQALDQLITQGIIDAADHRPVQIENTRDPDMEILQLMWPWCMQKPPIWRPAHSQTYFEHLPRSDSVQTTEIAGPGFINVRLAKGTAFEPVTRCLEEHNQFGFHQATDERVQVEFVSANPTGPLHVGHGRGAAYGATLVNLLKARGHPGWG